MAISLTLYQTRPCFYMSAVQVFLKTLGKIEIAHTEKFLLFPECFLPIWETFCHFHQIQICSLQTLSVWKTLKFVVWDRIKYVLDSYWKGFEVL